MSSTEHSESPAGAGVPRLLTVRKRGFLIAMVAVGITAVAVWLDPSRLGVGTHRQLGLPACTYLMRTGWPCPGCGITTSLAAMAHGRLSEAWQAHPFGVALFGLIVSAGLAGGLEGLTGRAILDRFFRPRGLVILAAVLLVGLLIGWAVKAGVGWACGDYPL